MKEPLVFEPLYQERVWGGRALESVYGRVLPRPEVPYGEAWELVDREEAQSVVRSGPLAGRSLGWLWRERRSPVFGERYAGREGRFPLLLKILDARERLSLQVHPPAAVAQSLGGEPKTEMWFIARAEPGALLYAGLRAGATREQFEAALAEGRAEELVQVLPVRAGQFLFLPSGRLHAIGAGLVIHEIQQNSDTTYRVFDWNRLGLDGLPRALHVSESLRSIDFTDVEPALGEPQGELLADCPLFRVERWSLGSGEVRAVAGDGRFAVVTIVSGRVACGTMRFGPGDSLLVPAEAEGRGRSLAALAGENAEVLRTVLP